MVWSYNNELRCQMDVLCDQSIAWNDSHMDNWRKINLQLTQWSYVIGLPRIVFGGQEIGTFSIKVWFSF